jgi:hypothetical protein
LTSRVVLVVTTLMPALSSDQGIRVGGDCQADRLAVGEFACVLAVLLR